MGEGLLPLLANRNNQAILGLLAVEAAYPRMVGQLLSLSETEVSRRLKRMEEAGLVVGEWQHVGKNVKLYRLAARGAGIAFTGEGVQVTLEPLNGVRPEATIIPTLLSTAPQADGFVGRDGDLETLRSKASVILVEGLPGIGKTSLLAVYAADAGPNVFWHSFRGVESLRWLANRLAVHHAHAGDRTLLEALAGEPDPADLHDLILQTLDRSDIVHILDDVHLVADDAVARLVTDAVTRNRNGRLRIASREPPRHDPSLGHVRVLELGGLDDAAVARLIAAKGMVVDKALLPRIRDEVGGHPLALNLLLETAQSTDGGLEALLDKIPEKATEEYLLREMYETLSDTEREALAHASLFRTGFTLEDLRAVSRRDPERAVAKLRRRLLVGSDGEQFQLHEVVRNFFYHRLSDKARLHEKAARRYLDLDTTEGRLEAMHHYLAAARRERVLQLLEDDLDLRAFDFLDAGYHNLYQTILESFTREEVADAKRWALIEDEKGDIAYHRGDYATALAHYEAALSAFEGKRDAERIADLSWKRALATERLGDHARARAILGEGLQVAPEDGVSRERLEALQGQLG